MGKNVVMGCDRRILKWMVIAVWNSLAWESGSSK